MSHFEVANCLNSVKKKGGQDGKLEPILDALLWISDMSEEDNIKQLMSHIQIANCLYSVTQKG